MDRLNDLFNMWMLEDFVKKGDKVLDVMTGKGDALIAVYPQAHVIVAVDIYEPYLDRLKATYPDAVTVCKDSLVYLKGLPDNSFDLVTCIDGVEHIEKAEGLELLEQMKRVSKKYVVVFTPEGLTLNTPHNAWGIAGGDEHQLHKSGWQLEELEELGFKLYNRTKWSNAYNSETYYSLLVYYEKV